MWGSRSGSRREDSAAVMLEVGKGEEKRSAA